MEDSTSPAPLPSIWASMNSWCTPTILFLFLNLMIGTILFTSNLHNNNNKEEDQNQNQKEKPNESKLARSPSILHRLRSFNFHPHRSQNQQDALEIAATQFVFNHPNNHSDLNPNRFESFEEHEHHTESDAQIDDFNNTNEVMLPNSQTHFVFEENHTIEKVTTHFDFGPENPEDSDTHGEEELDEFQSLDEVYSSITGGHVNRTKSDTLPASGDLPVKLPAKMKKSASMKSAFSHFEEEKIVEARRPATVRERRSAARAAEEDDVEVDAKADDFINKFKHQLKLQRLDSIIRYKDMVTRGSGK